MKKLLVIGKPIDHSLSPELHNHWIKKNKITAHYDKKSVELNDLPKIIMSVRENKIFGLNVTTPYKKEIIKYLDFLSPEAEQTESVNTVYKKGEKIIGHNTDIAGFELSLRKINYDIQGKTALILGSGGVVPSIVFALNNLQIKEINLKNRTKKKAELIRNKFKNVKVLEWNDECKFDIIINATSLGLNKNENIDINFENLENEKFFYDVIYNPPETEFLKNAKKNYHRIENGKMMFIYQAHQSFTLWHEIMPDIDEETLNIVK